ncbi:MAG: serine hydrolase [Prevotellaceae bacterium]|jgi:beta-glucosidase-like glycosyl hydrolase/CubicO group peptidase (beta-lactamase class C family)|nr:serine hydrolase [Prevotellaceae bacterium]
MSWYKKPFLLFALFVLVFSTKIQAKNNDAACRAWVDSVFATLTPDERIGQLFIYNTAATNDSKTLANLLRVVERNHIGGVLFWNGSLAAQADLTNYAQQSSKVPLFITLDGEWGLQMRLKDALRYSQKIALSALADDSLIYDLGAEIGRQCNEMRININFDPVLDVNLNPQNSVINTRSFGDDPETVTRNARLFIDGLHSRNILAAGKHFPGHGDTSQDSHREIATVTHDWAELDSVDLFPYRQLNNELDGIMVGHLAVPAIDSSGAPASLSPLIINDLLKDKMGYGGLIFTDAIKMKAVSTDKDAAVKALVAGNDMVLDVVNLDHDIDAVKTAIKENRLSMDSIDARCRKILRYKFLCGLNNYIPIELNGLESRVNTIDAYRLQAHLAEQSITIVKNDNDILPLKKLGGKRIAVVGVGAECPANFRETLALYDSVSHYTLLPSSVSPSCIQTLDSLFMQHETVIFSLLNTQIADSIVAQLCGNAKNSLLVAFISPYHFVNYAQAAKAATAVVLAYENRQTTQTACAQSLFGGKAVTGHLPITLPGLFEKHTCFDTPQTRLGYALPEDAGMQSTVLARIDSIANDAIAKGATPGCQVLVARRGQVVYQKSFGYHDYTAKQSVKNSDLYDVASVSKITATLPMLMNLYDEGNIKLDERAAHYLPDLRHTNKRTISIFDLLTHQAGLPAFRAFYTEAIDKNSYQGNLMSTRRDSIYSLRVDKNLFANKYFKFKPRFIAQSPDSLHNLQVADSLFVSEDFRDEVWREIKEVDIASEKKYVYSDLSFLMLQRVVEKLAGESLDSYTASLYEKLGASSSFNPAKRFALNTIVPTENDSFLRKQSLRGFVHDQNTAFMGGVAGHAGLFSSAGDLAKYCQLLLNHGVYGGDTLLSAKTVELFTTKHSSLSRRGLGFDRQAVKQSGSTAEHFKFGHYGFTGTCLWIDPEEELIYIFLSNRICPEHWNNRLQDLNIRSKIESVIYQSIKK